MRFSLVRKFFLPVIVMTLGALIISRSLRPQNRINSSFSVSHNGGVLVWGTINPPTIINPILTSHSISAALQDLLFDPLVHVDSYDQISPGLASRWEISSDGKVYTFYLRPGVYFHDGVELTAEDVKFTYDLIQDPANHSPWRIESMPIEKWTVVSRYVIQAQLREPFPLFLQKNSRLIIPKHLWENHNLAADSLNYAPVGTGPFRFKSWDKNGNEIVLERNPNYFGKKAYLNRIAVRVFKDNTALWAALMRSEVDLVLFLNQNDYKVLKEDSGFKTYGIPTVFSFALVYDLHDEILGDREIRKAISFAIDRERLMNIMGREEGRIFSATDDQAAYDPSKAQIILAQQGWHERDHDGILEKNGKKLEIRLLINSSQQYYLRMAAEIRQQLSMIGIKTVILATPNGNKPSKEFLNKYRPQMCLRMFSSTKYNYETVQSWYSLSSEYGKLWSYKNTRLDRLFEEIHKESNQKQKENLYREIYKIIDEDKPVCFLFSPMAYHAVSRRVHNTDDFFSSYMPTYLIKDWFIN